MLFIVIFSFFVFILSIAIRKIEDNQIKQNESGLYEYEYLFDQKFIFNDSLIEPLMIISRKEWNARQPEGDLKKIDLPSLRVIITDTETDSCSTQVRLRFAINKTKMF